MTAVSIATVAGLAVVASGMAALSSFFAWSSWVSWKGCRRAAAVRLTGEDKLVELVTADEWPNAAGDI